MTEALEVTRQEVQESFPAQPELEHERSELVIPLVAHGEHVETLRLTSLLKMSRYAPVTNSAGYRQFEFQIDEWEVAGFSETLGEWFTLTLTPGMTQPKSVCIAGQRDADYPATIVYNAVMDVYLGKRLVDGAVAGLGVGVEVTEIPPRTHVHFQKTFELAPDVVTLAAGCVSMASEDPVEWEQKAAEFRRLRSL